METSAKARGVTTHETPIELTEGCFPGIDMCINNLTNPGINYLQKHTRLGFRKTIKALNQSRIPFILFKHLI